MAVHDGAEGTRDVRVWRCDAGVAVLSWAVWAAELVTRSRLL